MDVKIKKDAYRYFVLDCGSLCFHHILLMALDYIYAYVMDSFGCVKMCSSSLIRLLTFAYSNCGLLGQLMAAC